MAHFEDQSLKDAFNPVSRKPAVRFEMKTGLSGISQEYVFPQGMTAREFEGLYFWRGGKMPPVWAQYADLPERNVEALPYDIDTFLNLSSPQLNALYRGVWEEMVKLNPVLADFGLDTTSTRAIYDALLGMASAFNLDDIDYYLDLRKDRRPAALESMQHPLNEEIREISGTRMEWAPSPKTMQRVAEMLRDKNWKEPSRDDIVKRIEGYPFK